MCTVNVMPCSAQPCLVLRRRCINARGRCGTRLACGRAAGAAGCACAAARPRRTAPSRRRGSPAKALGATGSRGGGRCTSGGPRLGGRGAGAPPAAARQLCRPGRLLRRAGGTANGAAERGAAACDVWRPCSHEQLCWLAAHLHKRRLTSREVCEYSAVACGRCTDSFMQGVRDIVIYNVCRWPECWRQAALVTAGDQCPAARRARGQSIIANMLVFAFLCCSTSSACVLKTYVLLWGHTCASWGGGVI